MIGETHRLGGIALGAVVATGMLLGKADIDLLSGAILISGAATGSLIPDIDHKGSMIGKRLPRLSAFVSDELDHRGVVHSLLGLFVFSLFTFVCGYFLDLNSSKIVPFLAVSACIIGVNTINFIIKAICKVAHRRISVLRRRQIDLLVIILCVVISWNSPSFISFIFSYYIVGLSVGYFSHLLLDTLNPTGIKWFYPNPKAYVACQITTGSGAEELISLVCKGVAIISVISFIVIAYM